MGSFDVRTRGDLNQEHHSVLSDKKRQFINKSVISVIVDLSETFGKSESVNKFLHRASIMLQKKSVVFFRARMLFLALSTLKDDQNVK